MDFEGACLVSQGTVLEVFPKTDLNYPELKNLRPSSFSLKIAHSKRLEGL